MIAEILLIESEKRGSMRYAHRSASWNRFVLAVIVAGVQGYAFAHEAAPSGAESRVASFRGDIEEFAETIRAEHPRPYRFQTQEAFETLVGSELDSVDASWDRRDLLWSMNRVIASIGCGHSGMTPYFNQEDQFIEPASRFPVEARLVDGRLIVIDPLTNDDLVSVGDEIQSINGRLVPDIVAEAFQHISADNNLPGPKRHRFNVYATSYLTYTLGFPDSFTITTDGRSTPCVLAPLEEFTHKPVVDPKDLCKDRLCYRTDPETGVHIMRIRSFAFYGEEGGVFAQFINDSFDAMAGTNDRPLIIDVRGNHGGSGLASAFLLRRLASEPFAYWDEVSDERAVDDLFELQRPVETGFDGKVYLLLNSDTLSVVPHFAALIKEHGMATILGEPAGGSASTNDGKGMHISSNHGAQYSVARMRFDVDAPSLSIDEPVMPDVRIAQTAEDVVRGVDGQLQRAIAFVARKD
jgi:hypothetical protein